MCQPDLPEMPEYKEQKTPPSTPNALSPQGVENLAAPVSTSAGQGDEVKIKKKSSKKDLLARTKGVNRFRIPLNTQGGGSGKGQLNIPR